MNTSLTVYLHFPCFDGLVSAVLASEYLERKLGWKTGDLKPVGYDLMGTWLRTPLEKPAAVVDFLFHPDADFWADHHQTSFPSDKLRENFLKRRTQFLLYDPQSLSCSSLLWRRIGKDLRDPRFREMASWADRIDGARYPSIRNAVLGNSPAMRISFSLIADSSGEYCNFLVRNLRKRNLTEVANMHRVRELYREVHSAIRNGLKDFKKSAHVERGGGIVVYDVENNGRSIVSRYAPYYFYPEALYSIGVSRSSEGSKITAMRNPWKRVGPIHLGQVFKNYGGGGHRRVASLLVANSRKQELARLLQTLLDEISPGSSKQESDRWREEPVIERFNFYDIYGYLLPGATLVGLLWLPFGIINRSWPAAQLAATVFVLGFSYVIGHVLQTIATTTVPSNMRDGNGKMRAPSDLIQTTRI